MPSCSGKVCPVLPTLYVSLALGIFLQHNLIITKSVSLKSFAWPKTMFLCTLCSASFSSVKSGSHGAGTKPPAVNNVMAHAEILDKRVSQSEPGWEYLLLVPPIYKVASRRVSHAGIFMLPSLSLIT